MARVPSSKHVVLSGVRGRQGNQGPQGEAPAMTAADVGADPAGTAATLTDALQIETALALQARYTKAEMGVILDDFSPGDPVTRLSLDIENVDNTADVDKPVSTAQQDALDAKVSTADVIDTLVSTEAAKPLSANQGRELNELITALPGQQALIDAVIAAIGGRLLPAGGAEGQALVKINGTDYGVEWADVLKPEVPPVELLLSAGYDPDTDQTRWTVRNIDTEELTIMDTAWAGFFVGDLGQVGVHKESGLALMGPNGADVAWSMNASDQTTIASNTEFAQYGGSYISPNGEFGVFCGYNGAAVCTPSTMLAAPGTLTSWGQIPHNGKRRFYGVAFSADSSTAYLGYEGGIQIFNTADWTLIEDKLIAGGMSELAFSSDRTRAVTRAGNTAKVWNVADWSLVATANPGVTFGPYYTHATSFMPGENDRIVVLTRLDPDNRGSARIYDIADMANPILISPQVDSPWNCWEGTSVVFSADNSRMFLSTYWGVHVYNTADWTYVKTYDENVQSASLVML